MTGPRTAQGGAAGLAAPNDSARRPSHPNSGACASLLAELHQRPGGEFSRQPAAAGVGTQVALRSPLNV